MASRWDRDKSSFLALAVPLIHLLRMDICWKLFKAVISYTTKKLNLL
jgi:hypothetical protein